MMKSNNLPNTSVAEKYINNLLGLSHLTTAEIYWLNLDYHQVSGAENTIRLYDHLAECRACRKSVRKLTFEDFKKAYPAHYAGEYVEQQYRYYQDPDPPPFFDEKISLREKLRQFYQYRENYFFDADEIRERFRRLKRKVIRRK